MSRAIVLACLLAIVLGASAQFSRQFIADKVLFNFDLFTAYISDPTVPFLPFVNESQLCYLVGAISGCSGCQHGTQGLCSWVGTYLQTVPFGELAAVYQCVPKDTASYLEANDLGWNASFSCPADPLDEPPFTELLWTSKGPLESERASVIHNTFHDLHFGDVDTRPWPVDRTSLYSAAGGMELWGYNDLFFGSTVNLFLNSTEWGSNETAAPYDIRRHVTCATLNDETALDLLFPSDNVCTSPVHHRLIDELLVGILWNENDAYCLEAIWGAYLSTRCPKYGTAVSGISYSLFLNFYRNCFPNPIDGRPGIDTREVHIGPSSVQVAEGVFAYFNILGLPIVPDGTPFALHDITIPPNEQFEEYTGIDSVHQNMDSPYPSNLYCIYAD
jgi:hypothetical protein